MPNLTPRDPFKMTKNAINQVIVVLVIVCLILFGFILIK